MVRSYLRPCLLSRGGALHALQQVTVGAPEALRAAGAPRLRALHAASPRTAYAHHARMCMDACLHVYVRVSVCTYTYVDSFTRKCMHRISLHEHVADMIANVHARHIEVRNLPTDSAFKIGISRHTSWGQY